MWFLFHFPAFQLPKIVFFHAHLPWAALGALSRGVGGGGVLVRNFELNP